MNILLMPKRKLHRHTRAQALLEMALVIPLLAVLLVGVFEFGLVLYAHVQVSNAAREAARAASLYRSTRFSKIVPNQVSSRKCDGSVLGWSLQQTVNQAIVYYVADTNGCPGTATIDYTSLGWLQPTTPTMWSATLTPAQSTYYSASSNPDSIPTAGDSVTIKLRYPYKLIILSKFMTYLSDPIWIEKSVKVEYQN